MTESTAPKPTTTPAAKPAVVPASNGAKPPADVTEIIEFVGVSDRRLAFGLLLVGIGVGALVVYFVLTRVIIEDTDHA